MTTFEVPLSSDGQTFKVSLDGAIYQLTVQWRNAIGQWLLDIADANGDPLVNGIPLVTGCNLVEQYRYLGFNGGLWVQGADDPDDLPGYADLGSSSHLFWVTT
ncbi:hypothetical protein KPA93_27545 [Burkholderia cenocepacia]|uniref:phage baseplate plug family protein n=1 Tax=Burkholderia cenocepacia TaxID=95486 RepID=UPI0028550428|nr:hypothetical protein [Burkholderia cenocepacia]MDR8026974.1 hypothetical protein [Burkholderia cenocepacia]MDR8044226.1 hypothetical protein [Burkholderia cenocepacia]